MFSVLCCNLEVRRVLFSHLRRLEQHQACKESYPLLLSFVSKKLSPLFSVPNLQPLACMEDLSMRFGQPESK